MDTLNWQDKMAYRDPEKKKQYQRLYYERNQEKLKSVAAVNYAQNAEQRKAYARKAYRDSPEIFKERAEKWRAENSEKYQQTRKMWEVKNYRVIRDYQNAYRREKDKERRESDPGFLIMGRLRARLRGLLRLSNAKRSVRTISLIGCSKEELVKHIEKQFVKGMTWKNRELWHIDHIRPCASFDFSDPVQQRECFHYSNLQPLWAVDNIKKRDKF